MIGDLKARILPHHTPPPTVGNREVTMLVAHILRHKGREVLCAAPQYTLQQAAELLGRRRIGALVVTDAAGAVLGILSERDVVRALGVRGAEALAEPVSQHMTARPTTIGEDADLDEVMQTMTEGRFRHLPVVEDGTVVLVGATTENPSFALNGALLSRCQVLVLRRLDDAALEELLVRAEAELGTPLPLTPEGRQALRAMADGDGRYLLNMVEQVAALPPGGTLDAQALADVLARRAALYDRDREEHYNLISALHKSLRGSDVDAALYWFARMLAGGEDPRYIARRLLRFASEDIGLADPQAMPHTLAAWEAYERLGSPEGELALAQAVIYLGTAPKSNAAYTAIKAAQRSARDTGSLMPPAHILNAPTKLMKNLGYGAGYNYDHDAADAFSGQNYFPDGMERPRFYAPRDRGFEREIAKRLDYWAQLRAERGA